MRSLLWSETVAKVVLNGEYTGAKGSEVDFSDFSKGGRKHRGLTQCNRCAVRSRSDDFCDFSINLGLWNAVIVPIDSAHSN